MFCLKGYCCISLLKIIIIEMIIFIQSESVFLGVFILLIPNVSEALVHAHSDGAGRWPDFTQSSSDGSGYQQCCNISHVLLCSYSFMTEYNV